MKHIFILTLIIFSMTVFAQKGVVTSQDLEQIRKFYDKNDSQTKALTNALSNNDVKKIALNRDNIGKIDHNFKYKVDVKGISNQKSSGRCWMFTSMNVLRPKVIEKYSLGNFEFSHNYLYFWDIFEKSNLNLELQIMYADKPMDNKYVERLFKSPVGDGGVWNSFTNLADKYGMVPKSVMPETNTSESTGSMTRIINRKLREDGLELRKMYEQKTESDKVKNRKVEMLGEIYRILCLNLGEPPVEFEYRFADKNGELTSVKKYTPKSFMSEVLGELDFTENVMLMNDPTREYYKMYEIEYDRNVMEGRNWVYLNLPSDEIKKAALESIKNNDAMYASCDVGKQLNSSLGFSAIDNYDFESLYGVKFGMDKAQRIKTFESGSSHGMALVAVDVDENNKPVKWQFENSWGATSGHNGYLTFTDKWFDEYMFRVVVLKKYLDAKTLNLLKKEPIKLPPWDPMFKADE